MLNALISQLRTALLRRTCTLLYVKLKYQKLLSQPSVASSLLVDHPPEVGDSVVERPLRADPPLPVLVAVDKVGVDVVGAVDVFDLAQLHSGLVIALDVGIP